MISLIFTTLFPVLMTGDFTDNFLDTFDFKAPNPYIGYHFTVFPTKHQETAASGSGLDTYKRRKKFLALGAPFQTHLLKFENFRPIPLMTVPEVFLHNDLFQLNLGYGPEISIPLNQIIAPNAFLIGAQVGMFWLWYYNPKTNKNDNNVPFRDADKMSYGAWFNTYFGPKFEILGKYSFNLLVNPKVYLGKIARHTLRVENYRSIGFTLGLNLQWEFL